MSQICVIFYGCIALIFIIAVATAVSETYQNYRRGKRREHRNDLLKG